jgi:hypothetical protein
MLDDKSFRNLGCTLYVYNMYGGATWTKSGHFLGMKPIEKNHFT